jgi:aminoglycoside phosphotransferase (APT) family kinase protein
MIIRQHGEVDLKHNPHVAAVEFKLLQLLHSVGLAVPTPYHLDQSGEIFSTPYVVMEYIEGKPEFAPCIGYLVHPFPKLTTWSITTLLFSLSCDTQLRRK